MIKKGNLVQYVECKLDEYVAITYVSTKDEPMERIRYCDHCLKCFKERELIVIQKDFNREKDISRPGGIRFETNFLGLIDSSFSPPSKTKKLKPGRYCRMCFKTLSTDLIFKKILRRIRRRKYKIKKFEKNAWNF